MTQQTQKPFYHWKKNLDSKFISGEDLKASLNGLKPEMTVVIEKFGDNETFDQNAQKKKPVTDLYLKEVGGASLYKPALLNRTNAKVFIDEFKSDNVYDWIGKPITMYAQADRRHGFVVRFRSAPQAQKLDNTSAMSKVRESKNLAELEINFKTVAPELQTDAEVRGLVKSLGEKFKLKDLYESKKAKLGVSDQRNYERILNESEVESYAKMKTELDLIK